MSDDPTHSTQIPLAGPEAGQSMRQSTPHPLQEERRVSPGQEGLAEATEGQFGPESPTQSRLDEARSDIVPNTPQSASPAPSSRAGAATPAILAELQQRFRDERRRLEVKRLTELWRQYEQGDLDALQQAEAALNPTGAAPIQPLSTRSNLPRPEPPHRYEKKTRADYDEWVRDNEDYHRNNRADFTSEGQKVSFGLRYISQALRTVWEVYVKQKQTQNPMWAPTWLDLKEKMLEVQGTAQERKQAAFESVKACKQRPGQSPTDLLNYLRPLWVELGEIDRLSDYRIVAEYTAALNEDIKRELHYIPPQGRQTLSQVETEANRIYRKLAKEGKGKKAQPKDKRGASSTSDVEQGPKQPKKPRKDKEKGHQKKIDPERAKKGRTEFRCYACGQLGHGVPTCPDTTKKEAYIAKKEKSKGQKD